MNKQLLMCLLVVSVLILSGCSSKNKNNDLPNNPSNPGVENAANTVEKTVDNVQTISDIQKTENVGKTFTVKGKVVNTLHSERYGISGYKIQDSSGTMIDVSSSDIPQINTTVTVTGTLIQTRYFGLVINETGREP